MKSQRKNRTFRSLTENLWLSYKSPKFSSHTSPRCFQSGSPGSTTKISFRVGYSTQWEKCSQLWKISCMMCLRAKMPMPCMKSFQLPHLPTSTQWLLTIKRRDCERPRPQSREKLAITLRIENDKACLKLSTTRLARGMPIPNIRRGLIPRTCTLVHLWSIRQLSNRSSSQVIRTQWCITTRTPKSAAITSRIFEVCKSMVIAGPSSSITTVSLSCSTRFLTRPWWLRQRVASRALRRTESCRGLAWTHLPAIGRMVTLNQPSAFLATLWANAYRARGPFEKSNLSCTSAEQANLPFKSSRKPSKGPERATGEQTDKTESFYKLSL